MYPCVWIKTYLFNVYRLGMGQMLSLEQPMADFLKKGINMWLIRIETFCTFKYWTKRIAREMFRINDDTPITCLHWLTHVANNENVIPHLDSVLKNIHRASGEEPMGFDELISEINNLTRNRSDYIKICHQCFAVHS